MMANKKAEVRYWTGFSLVAMLALVVSVVGRSFIPETWFVLLLAVSLMANVVAVIWGFLFLPCVIKASTEGFREMNDHPDALVRALQREEITIEEYARRRLATQTVGPDDVRG